jgi:hypothetical protein
MAICRQLICRPYTFANLVFVEAVFVAAAADNDGSWSQAVTAVLQGQVVVVELRVVAGSWEAAG